MFSIMFKTWLVTFVIYLFGHFIFVDYIRSSAARSLQNEGYHYVTINSASLSYDALLRTESSGSLVATMDGREVALNLHVEGNPVWSKNVIVSVAMPHVAGHRFTLGAQ